MLWSALVATWNGGTPHRIQQAKEAVRTWYICWIWHFMDNGLSCSSTICRNVTYWGDVFVCVSFLAHTWSFSFSQILAENYLELDSYDNSNELLTQIQVWEHTCDVGEARPASFHDRRSPQWDMHLDSSSENKLLKELEFAGFKSQEQQFTFIRSMLERAPNLQMVILKGDERCEYCDALDTPRALKFPKKDEQEMVVRRIQDGKFSPQIVFDE